MDQKIGKETGLCNPNNIYSIKVTEGAVSHSFHPCIHMRPTEKETKAKAPGQDPCSPPVSRTCLVDRVHHKHQLPALTLGDVILM